MRIWLLSGLKLYLTCFFLWYLSFIFSPSTFLRSSSFVRGSCSCVWTHVDGSSNSHIHNPFPQTLSSSCWSLCALQFLDSSGCGSKDSMLLATLFLIFPNSCFSKCTSATSIAAALRFQGSFYWQGNNVTGIASSSLSSSENTRSRF